jgi:hypothetical protein
MAKFARYIIILDRMDDDEAVSDDGRWPENESEGRNQVANELQHAMEVTGQPAGFFRVVARAEVEYTGELAYTIPDEDAHRAAMQVLDNTRTY